MLYVLKKIISITFENVDGNCKYDKYSHIKYGYSPIFLTYPYPYKYSPVYTFVIL